METSEKSGTSSGCHLGTTPEAAVARILGPYKGIAKLSAEKLLTRGVEFDVPDDTGHLHATNVPFYELDRPGAVKMGLLMCECVVDYNSRE